MYLRAVFCCHLFFILYINNLNHNVPYVSFHFDTDNTVMYYSALTADQALFQLQTNINTQYFHYLLLLVINADKTKVTLFFFLNERSKSQNPSWIFSSQGTQVQLVPHNKYPILFIIGNWWKYSKLKLNVYFTIIPCFFWLYNNTGCCHFYVCVSLWCYTCMPLLKAFMFSTLCIMGSEVYHEL